MVRRWSCLPTCAEGRVSSNTLKRPACEACSSRRLRDKSRPRHQFFHHYYPHVFPVKFFTVQFDIVKKICRVVLCKRPICEACSIGMIEVHKATLAIHDSLIISLSPPDFRQYILLARCLNIHTVEWLRKHLHSRIKCEYRKFYTHSTSVPNIFLSQHHNSLW